VAKNRSGGIIVKRLALVGVCLCVLVQEASAATCSSGLYLEVASRMRTIASGSAGCERALKGGVAIATMCGKCRLTVNRVLALDSLLRKNAACFRSDRNKTTLNKLRIARQNLQFIKRGCGF
jgi:hypothetical protein